MLTIEPPGDNTAQKIRFTQICLEQKNDAKKYKLGGNQKQIMVNTTFAYPVF